MSSVHAQVILTPVLVIGNYWVWFALLPLGYNQIFIIPMGALSIRIKEATPTRNFLGKLSIFTILLLFCVNGI